MIDSTKINNDTSQDLKKIKSNKEPFKKDVQTMQDDIVDALNLKKNHQSAKKELTTAEKEIQRNLTQVYTDSDGEIPDMTKLEKGQRPTWKTVLYTAIIILAIFLTVSLAGFFIFLNWEKQDSFTNEKITFKIEPPITVVSGQSAEYVVIITNKEKVNLYNAKVTLIYPENFEYQSSEPQAGGEKNNQWDFSVLKIGETKEIKIRGQAIASLDTALTFKGEMEFKPANLNADFKQAAIADVKVAASVISLDIVGPEKALLADAVEYTINYQNTDKEREFSDLQLVVEYPEGFVLDSADPETAAEQNNIWPIKTLAAEGSGKVVIKGNYSASKGGNHEFKARIQLKQGEDYYVQAEKTLVTDVVKDQLNLQLVVNGSAEDQPIGFEDLLIYTLSYENTGQEILKNIEITAHLNSEILDWDSLKDENKGTVKNQTIAWMGKQIPQLLKLNAGEKGEISWQVRVKNASVVSDGQISRFAVEAWAQALIKQIGETTQNIEVRSKTVTNSINSDLSLNAAARYYNEENVALGLGPVTPTVGKTSTYNIKLDLDNNLHEIKDLRIEAILPKGKVKWANKESHNLGDLIYDSSANKVVWLISDLAKNVSDEEANFNIGITPAGEDAGRVLILVSEIRLTGQDKTTGAAISKNLKALTTAFNDPILGPVAGIVE